MIIQLCYDCYTLIELLPPWCRVLLEQLTGLQLVKKFPAFHGTPRFITALTTVRHLSISWASPLYPANLKYVLHSRSQKHDRCLWLWTTSFFTSFLQHTHTHTHTHNTSSSHAQRVSNPQSYQTTGCRPKPSNGYVYRSW